MLAEGALVAFPTETVYGLGARADDDHAVEKIFKVKGRPVINPLIIHTDTLEKAQSYAVFSSAALRLAAEYWPGPLTLVLPLCDKRGGLSPLVTAGLNTVAVRCPAHPVARELLRQVDFAVAAPSANRSGCLSPTRAAHVASSLDSGVGLILQEDNVYIGLESTILDLSDYESEFTGSCSATLDSIEDISLAGHGRRFSYPRILRPGFITSKDLSATLGVSVIDSGQGEEKARLASGQAESDFEDSIFQRTQERISNFPKAPGQLLSHYAPNAPVRLNVSALRQGEVLLAFGAVPESLNRKTPPGMPLGTSPEAETAGFSPALAGGRIARNDEEALSANLSEKGDVNEAAANLYSMLHKLDQPGVKAIAVMTIPDKGVGRAINERLNRAAYDSGRRGPAGAEGGRE